MSKFCIKCGKELSDGIKFCTNCGTKIEMQENYEVKPEPQENQQQNFNYGAVQSTHTVNKAKGALNHIFECNIQDNNGYTKAENTRKSAIYTIIAAIAVTIVLIPFYDKWYWFEDGFIKMILHMLSVLSVVAAIAVVPVCIIAFIKFYSCNNAVTKYITANPTLSKRGANLKVAISILAAAVVMFAVLLPTMEKVDYIAFKNYSDRIDDMDTDSDNTKSTSYSSAVTVASDNDSLCFKMNIDEFINAYNDLDDVKKDSMLKLDMAKAKKSSFDKLDANQKQRKGIMYQWNNQYSVMASVDRKDPNIQEGFVVFCNDYGEITGISYVITNHLFDIYEANGKSYLPTQDSYRAFSVVNPYLIFDEYCDILQEILDNGYTYKYDDGILYQCGKDEERDTWIYSMQALTKEDYEGYVNARENKGNN